MKLDIENVLASFHVDLCHAHSIKVLGLRIIFNDVLVLGADITVFELGLFDVLGLKKYSVWHP